MFELKLFHILVFLNVALFVRAASVGLELESVYVEPIEGELIRDKREADPRRGHLLNLLASNKYNNNYYRPTGGQEYHHGGGGGGGGSTATFAQSSAGTINVNNGHGHNGGGASQASSQSASYNFGPFSASFSTSQANGNSGGFFDY